MIDYLVDVDLTTMTGVVELGDDRWAVKVKYEVCPHCSGHGQTTNPAIDGNGISQEQFDDDPEFERDYHSGAYDIECTTCRAQRVVAVPITSLPRDKEMEDAMYSWMREEHVYQQECEAERRAGA